MNRYNKNQSALPLLPIVLSTIFFFSLFLFSMSENQDSLTTEAKISATAWLKIIDHGKYKESYDQSSLFFKEEVTSKKWVEALNSVRKPLGEQLSRKIILIKIQNEIPYAGQILKGTYCIIQIESSFQNLKSSIETISLQLEADAQWRVAGYFIKPKTQ